MAFDSYQVVTNRIIAELEKGNIPWRKGWTGVANGAYNLYSKRPYNLLNQMLLKHNDAYISFDKCRELGGRVNKGAEHEIVTSWFYVKKAVKDANGDPVLDDDGNEMYKTIPRLRVWQVFWVGDTTLEVTKRDEIIHEPVKEAEAVIQEYLLRETELKFINTEPSNNAYYSPTLDEVHVPMLSQFAQTEEYYSTAFHELTHSTGSVKRLNRLVKDAAFGSENYSKEELVAELGAAMLVNQCGIETEKSFRNNAGYIQGWLAALKDDKRLIVGAASKAEKAVKYIMEGNE